MYPSFRAPARKRRTAACRLRLELLEDRTVQSHSVPVALIENASDNDLSSNVTSLGPPTQSSVNEHVRLTEPPGMPAATIGETSAAPAKPAVTIAGPSTGVQGQPLTFTLGASESGLVKEAVYTFSVDWETDSIVDESALGASGVQATHVFERYGTYMVSATAIDPAGTRSDPATAHVTIAANQPKAGISGPSRGTAGQAVTFTLSASEPYEAAGSKYAFRIAWGDSSDAQTTSGLSDTAVSHTFVAAGAYTISVTATDSFGNTSAAVAAAIIVDNVDEKVSNERSPSDSAPTTAKRLGDTARDVSLPPLSWVKATAEPGPESPTTQLLGNPAAVSVLVPVPEFLKPAGTATVATPLTGSVALTHFEIDNGALDRLPWNAWPADGWRASLNAPTWPDRLSRTLEHGVVNLIVPPLRIECLGIRVESRLAIVTVSFENVPRGFLARLKEISDSLVRSLAQAVSAVAARLIDAAAQLLDLAPPLFVEALRRLAPAAPTTVHIAQFRLNALDVRFRFPQDEDAGFAASGADRPGPNPGRSYDESTNNQFALDWEVVETEASADRSDAYQNSDSAAARQSGSRPSVQRRVLGATVEVESADQLDPELHLSTPGVEIDVFADTGPDKPLGNLLVAANRMRGADSGKSGPRDKNFETDGFDEDALPNGKSSPLSNGRPGSSPSQKDKSSEESPPQEKKQDTGPKPFPIAVVLPPRAAPTPYPGDSSGPDRKMTAAAPPFSPRFGAQPQPDRRSQESPTPDDEPLPRVLPEIGLPDESAPPRMRGDDLQDPREDVESLPRVGPQHAQVARMTTTVEAYAHLKHPQAAWALSHVVAGRPGTDKLVPHDSRPVTNKALATHRWTAAWQEDTAGTQVCNSGVARDSLNGWRTTITQSEVNANSGGPGAGFAWLGFQLYSPGSHHFRNDPRPILPRDSEEDRRRPY